MIFFKKFKLCFQTLIWMVTYANITSDDAIQLTSKMYP